MKEKRSKTQEEKPQRKATSRGLRIAAWIGASLFVLTVGFTAGWLGHYYSLDPQMRSFIWAKSIAERYYYREVDENVLYENLFGALDLDPYTHYYPKDDYTDYVESGAGHNVGIGVALTDGVVDGRTLPRFFSVIENSPAAHAGLARGMYLLGYGKTAEEAQAEKWGSSAQFTEFIYAQQEEFYLRCGYRTDGSDSATVSLSRSGYQAAYVYYRDSGEGLHFRYPQSESLKGDLSAYAERTEDFLLGADEKTAYIRIDEFSGLSDKEFLLCLSEMRARGRENLILDIRSNGGGYLDLLCNIAGHLLKNATGNSPVVAKAVYRDDREERFFSDANDYTKYFTENSRVVLLADESTASASEALIGALIDYGTAGYSDLFLREDGKGVARTYGKGIMQSHFENPFTGEAMKVTVAYIAWPLSGRCIQDDGVRKEDGANAVPAQKVWGAEDPMLQAAIASLAT